MELVSGAEIFPEAIAPVAFTSTQLLPSSVCPFVTRCAAR